MRALVPRLHRISTRVQESLADISHHAQETFAGVRVVKGYGVAAQQIGRFESASRENRDHQVALARVRGMTDAITHTAFNLTFLPILFVGGMAMIDRSLVAGDLFKFIDLTLRSSGPWWPWAGWRACTRARWSAPSASTRCWARAPRSRSPPSRASCGRCAAS